MTVDSKLCSLNIAYSDIYRFSSGTKLGSCVGKQSPGVDLSHSKLTDLGFRASLGLNTSCSYPFHPSSSLIAVQTPKLRANGFVLCCSFFYVFGASKMGDIGKGRIENGMPCSNLSSRPVLFFCAICLLIWDFAFTVFTWQFNLSSSPVLVGGTPWIVVSLLPSSGTVFPIFELVPRVDQKGQKGRKSV